jgi:lysozyme family protein
MDKEFEKALKFTLKWEGNYSNDPNDPGGETKYGISKKSYPTLDIKNLTLEKAKEIYYQNYWLKADCDKIPFPFNITVFDTAVNCGVERAKRFYQISIGWQDYLFLRIEYYTKLKTAKYFLRGWINRVVDLYNSIRIKENM